MVSEANIVTETAARICADLADPQIINGASGGQWKAPLWRALEDAGLTRAWVSGQLGGAGGTISDGFSVIGVAGRYALPVPPSETLLASASSKPPNTNLRNRLATKDRDFKGDGRAPNFVER